MIRYLRVSNLAVLEEVTVEFEHAFNVLTGETGAGKSILVEAVGLLLGGRATGDLVRTGADAATVEALFEDATGTDIVVRREVTAQGRSRAFIDDRLATATALRALASGLVEMHGQHEHQRLLDPAAHLPILDEWARLTPAVAAVAERFDRVQTLRGQIARAGMDHRERAARLELVAFHLGELERTAPRKAEDTDLEQARQLLRNAERLERLSNESYALLYDDEGSILTQLGRVWRQVDELASLEPRFGAYAAARTDIQANLEDLSAALRDFGSSLDHSPEHLAEVEDRLALLERLKRKHGPTLDDVLATWERLRVEHDQLSATDGDTVRLQAALDDASAAYLSDARAVSDARHAAAAQLSRALAVELAELAMADARVDFRLATDAAPDRWTATGLETGEIYLSANPGEDLKPLARIASGGELSRVMLALKTLAIPETPGRTLIFDEVDAGIGGRAATVVGERLRRLGDRFQVLCITHLPQIAAAAASHFQIEKAVHRGRTTTTVEPLDVDARVDALARMMGGSTAGAQARAGALELLQAAQAGETPGAPAAKAKGESRRGAKAKVEKSGLKS